MNRKGKSLLLLADFLIFSSLVGILFQYFENLSPLLVIQAFGFWFTTGFLLVGYYVFGTYDVEPGVTRWSLLSRILVAALISSALIIFVNYLGGKDRGGLFGRGVLLGSVGIFVLLSTTVRFVILRFVDLAAEKQSSLVICSAEKEERINLDLQKYNFKGKVTYVREDIDAESLQQYLKQAWSQIVLAVDHLESTPGLSEALMSARFAGVRVMDLVQFYEVHFKKVPVFHLGHRWFILTDGFKLINNPMGLRLKRVADIIISFFLLLLLWPLMLVTALIIKLESRGDALYSQMRSGKDDSVFNIYKFRSMRVDAEKSGAQWAQINDDRITRFGNFIRKTRIDELPQLWNVLKGEMSFIGPRPERPEFNKDLEKAIPFYQFRHLVRPGLTGWAQIMYPYGASVEDAREKLQYELYYIKNYSLFLDVRIFLKTAGVVSFGRGR